MQADILDLEKFNKQFDIIESGGVLHHMDNPMEGWKVLTDCLKPGGLMMIGLYSELARNHIVKIREEIEAKGIGSNDIDMKTFRNKILISNQKHHIKIKEFTDLYSLSEFRDLLFHVQEHRFTIPQIKNCLAELGLKFCGFESSKIVSHFKLTNKHKEDPYDLDKWQAYEDVNPTAFAGMYQFWCQKDL